MQLFEACPLCTELATAEISKIIGTQIHVTQKCTTCSYSRVWRGQPNILRIPAGNLLLSATILYSGSMVSQTLRMLKILKVQCFSRQTFHKHQKNYLIPVVVKMWKQEQDKVIASLSNLEGGLVLSRDGRSDSLGHCTKYGAFTVNEQRVNKELDVQLVQSNEVRNSLWCEHEELLRMVRFLASKNLQLEVIITDRNCQNAAYIRNHVKPNGTTHYYDIWHIAKGIGKKIDALAKQKDCEDAGLWRKSIVNHLYWIAVAAPEGNGEMGEAMWKSVTNNIRDVHDGHGELYPECAHGPLDEDERDKEWLQPSSKVCEKLTDILLSKPLLKDIKMISPRYQTSSLEALHSLNIIFAPKHTAFAFLAMYARLLLAALHYNENISQLQAVTKDGRPCYSIRFPKYKKGEYSVRKEKTSPTYDYTEVLIDVLVHDYEEDQQSLKNSIQDLRESIPGPLSAAFEKPCKETAVEQFVTRFANQE
ncbi:uncharacterized protein [Montipora capricornis]|uniref:uncharacterized protein n=1 Tax=Montipora capricornis TaxID=246305 RepID=UPI0035F0FB3E